MHIQEQDDGYQGRGDFVTRTGSHKPDWFISLSLAIAAVIFCGLIFQLGYHISQYEWEKKAIDNGWGRYNAKTGAFEIVEELSK